MTEIDLKELGNKAESLGAKLTMGVTVPIVLIVLGFMTLPLGILAWVAAYIIAYKTFN